MSLMLQPVRVANGPDEEGLLVFTGEGRLVAVLTRLSDQHQDLAGHWYLEAGFGRLDAGPHHATFADLDTARTWILERLAIRHA
jgi:hypothetical protein